MNASISIALNPVARFTAVMANLASDLFPVAQQRAAAAYRTAGPAAEMLRTLPARATLTVVQPLGLEVVCLKGTLWITHDGDTIDHVVEAGCTYTAKRSGSMLIHALTEARLIVEPAAD